MVIETHDVSGKFEALRTEGRSHQIESLLALPFRHLVETEAFANIGTRIAPSTPLRVVDRIRRLGALLLRQGPQEVLRRLHQIRGRFYPSRIDGIEALDGGAIGRNPHIGRQGLSMDQFGGPITRTRRGRTNGRHHFLTAATASNEQCEAY